MKKILLSLLVCSIFCANAQVIQFNNWYNLTQSPPDVASFIWNVILSDTCTIFSGSTSSDVIPKFPNPIIGKLNLHGDTMWTKTPITSEISRPIGNNNLIKISENKYLQVITVWDTLMKYPNITHYPIFHFFNSNGDSILTQSFKDTFDNRWAIMTAFSGNSIFISGIAESYTTHLTVVGATTYSYSDTIFTFISKYDTLGNHIWTKRLFPKVYNGDGYEFVHCNIIPSKNGGIIMSTYGDYDVPYSQKPKFLSFDSSGNMLWVKSYKPNIHRNSYPDAWICNGEHDTTYYFLTNCATVPAPNNLPSGNSLLYYGKINSYGDTLWTRVFADTGLANGYKETRARQIKYFNNKLYLLSYVYYAYDTVSKISMHPTLVICDSIGKVNSYREYQKTYTYASEHRLYDMDINNERIVLGGYWYNIDTIPTIMDSLVYLSWVVQADSFGCILPGCQSIDTIWNVAVNTNNINKDIIDITIYPNPSTSYVNIKTELRQYKIEVYNTEGKKILSKHSEVSTNIDLSQFTSGLYYIKISKDTHTKTFKVIKE
jgi:hypothetical protein